MYTYKKNIKYSNNKSNLVSSINNGYILLSLIFSLTMYGCINNQKNRDAHCTIQMMKKPESSANFEFEKIKKEIQKKIKKDVKEQYNLIKGNNNTTKKVINVYPIFYKYIVLYFNNKYYSEQDCALYIIDCLSKERDQGNKNKIINEKISWKNIKLLEDTIKRKSDINIKEIQEFYENLIIRNKIKRKNYQKKELYKLIKEAALCAICYDMLKTPIKTLKCGHSYCKNCIYTKFEYDIKMKLHPNCPLCREKIKSFSENIALNNIIEAIQKKNIKH